MASRISIFSAVVAGLLAVGPQAGATDDLNAPSAGAVPLATPAPLAAPKAPARRPFVRAGNTTYSTECKVKSPAYEGRAALRSVRRAVLEKRPVRVIALGSSSTVGIGASSPLASYPVRLENDLEGVIEGLQVEMFPRGQSGEVAEGAAERLKAEVAEIKPDLIVWQVGTNDAVARIDADDFGDQLRDTLSWLASHKIDVVLIDPQYVERLSKDERYTSIVNEIATVASEMRVLLVNRYDAMADLARQHPGSSYLSNDRFHLNDLGYRCMAEYATRAIVAGVLQADIENGAMH
ncbi:SGNH/GDSL hydrolase family protein [Hyphomicrobium sp. LHD-15]|uniref:SGNH/GDSL hydrolase family protein n=1 Tax=Hyphomicrobium sp. LHD-15 TaxID=3072142 RepID=UPI00280FD2F0|nr:SGNH/GDSL hydrolase family protein [Hyphomicrobium sp. LHD-15]MDQ8698212.1 SGNH/GDSL hydrolase family protein [Hyphomicrobium sp. LHD-15]